MNRSRKKKKAQKAKALRISGICGWCGEPIRSGEESDNYYEVDERWIASVGSVMGPVHKAHVREEDHPLYDQMPPIVFTGLPDILEGVYEGW